MKKIFISLIVILSSISMFGQTMVNGEEYVGDIDTDGYTSFTTFTGSFYQPEQGIVYQIHGVVPSWMYVGSSYIPMQPNFTVTYTNGFTGETVPMVVDRVFINYTDSSSYTIQLFGYVNGNEVDIYYNK